MVDGTEGKGTEGGEGGKGESARGDGPGAPTMTSPVGYVPAVQAQSAIREAETPLERPRDSEGNRRDSASSGRQRTAREQRAQADTEPPSDDGPTEDEQPLPVQHTSTGKTEHTMRSVDTPQPTSRQPWDERRIGTLELEVEHIAANVKLLEKSLERAQLEARVRSLVLLVVVVVALLARVL